MTDTSDSNFIISDPIIGQIVDSWIVVIPTTIDGDIYYGGFPNKETAIDFGKYFLPAKVIIAPVYWPSLNRG